MAAGDRIYTLTSATFGADVPDVTHAGISPGTTVKTDPGPGDNPGPADQVVTDKRMAVTLYGLKYASLLALVGAVAANLVLNVKGLAGAAETITLKNVYFSGVPQEIPVARKDEAGSPAIFAVSGQCNWGAADTFATMMASG